MRLAQLPLLATGLSYVFAASADIKIKLKNGQEYTAQTLAQMMINQNKIEEDLEQQQGLIEALSYFSTVVDPDLVVR